VASKELNVVLVGIFVASSVKPKERGAAKPTLLSPNQTNLVIHSQ
jgi:hypothetical protein